MSTERFMEGRVEGHAELERDEGTVEYLCKVVGARGILGLEFYYRGALQTRSRRVRLDKFDFARDAYKGTDVQANVGLVEDISPKNLTVGLGSRKRGEPVIKLLEACNIGVRQFLDPMLRESGEREPEFFTPPSDFMPFRRRELPGVRSVPPSFGEEGLLPQGGTYLQEAFGGIGHQGYGGEQTPRPYSREGRGTGILGERVPVGGGYGRVAPPALFAPQAQHHRPFMGTPRLPESPFRPPQIAPAQPEPMHAVPPEARVREARHEWGGYQGYRRTEGGAESLEERVTILEKQRSAERARGAITTEMRRMQAAISPVDHPGLYSNADQMAVIHDCPLTHKGIMALAGTCMAVTKNVDIKLSYLAEAEWENTRRLCAEGGENLTEEQVIAIEAKVLEFHQKQMVEAKKIKEKLQMAEKGTGRGSFKGKAGQKIGAGRDSSPTRSSSPPRKKGREEKGQDLSRQHRVLGAEEEPTKGACCQFEAAVPMLTEDLCGEDRRKRPAPEMGKATESPVETGRPPGLDLIGSRVTESEEYPIENERPSMVKDSEFEVTESREEGITEEQLLTDEDGDNNLNQI